MNFGTLFPTVLRRRHGLAALLYTFVVAGLFSAAAWAAVGLVSDADDLDKLRDRLAELDKRVAAGKAHNTDTTDSDAGSPFIEGATITQAGANLQQRIERAVARAGGTLTSSQVDLDRPEVKSGVIGLVANLEIAQPALQGFIYDIEAGTPYLVIDSLNVQSPQAAGDAEGSRMRVAIGVSGNWEPSP